MNIRQEKQTAHLIYLRAGDKLLLSKKRYANWREIQDEYEDFLTSLGPWSAEDINEFFREDFGKDETEWPFSAAQIHSFMNSNDRVLRSE